MIGCATSQQRRDSMIRINGETIEKIRLNGENIDKIIYNGEELKLE